MKHFLTRADLRTYDPYDIWKTGIGSHAKDWYNRRPLTALPLVAPLALADNFLNGAARFLYQPAEYPVVRSLAALSLLNLYRASGGTQCLDLVKRHLDWLLENSCRGYSGHCWGLGFHYPVRRDIVYGPNTPLTTMTPYALEAFADYSETTRDPVYSPVISSIMNFFDSDVQTMAEDRDTLATSYGPFRDRIVINAISYTMFANALYLPSCSNAPDRERKIAKLFAYIQRAQRSDGSWFYSPEGPPFIDCFHTCIVLKNIVKTARTAALPESGAVVEAGYSYLKRELLDEKRLLFRRFSVRNKPGLVQFDLYDNAEALNLALLLGDRDFAGKLLTSILATFSRGADLYSQIDFLGVRRGRNTLRWAVMPFLYAASQVI